MAKYLVWLIVIIFISCSGSKKTTIEPVEIDNFTPPILNSSISINYKINKKSLIDTFNFIVDELSKTPLVMNDYNVTTKIKRSGNVGIDIIDRDFKTTLPIEVNVDKKTFIKDLKANGILELSFVTHFDIDKNWNLTTKTDLIGNKWIKAPQIDLGVLNLPIETIGNMVINKIKPDLEKNIDQSIKESYNLRAIIKEISEYTLTPYKLNDVFGGWMQMEADTAFFSPAINTKNYTEGKITLKTRMNISSTPPTIKKINLPVFSWNNKLKDSSTLSLPMELEYEYLNKIARESFVGQTFSDGGKSVQVIDLNVGKSDGKLEVTVKTKGDFNGSLSLKGIPAFDKKRRLFYAKDIDVKVKTGNVLHKAAAWLMKGKIKSELDKMLVFPIDDQMANLQKQVDSQVEAMNKKYSVKMKVVLGSLDLNNVILRPDRANIYVSLNFKLDTTLDNLVLFRD